MLTLPWLPGSETVPTLPQPASPGHGQPCVARPGSLFSPSPVSIPGPAKTWGAMPGNQSREEAPPLPWPASLGRPGPGMLGQGRSAHCPMDDRQDNCTLSSTADLSPCQALGCQVSEVVPHFSTASHPRARQGLVCQAREDACSLSPLVSPDHLCPLLQMPDQGNCASSSMAGLSRP